MSNFLVSLHKVIARSMCLSYGLLTSSLLLSNATFAGDPATYYYPPTSPANDSWTTESAVNIGWDQTKLDDAVAYAQAQNSAALIVLHKGKIISENYWQGWGLHTSEKVFSVHKTISTVLFGIMQDQGLVHRDDYVSSYLTNWSNATATQEAAVQISHLQTMTSGMGEQILAGNIFYQNDPDTQWEYNTLAYRKMNEIIEQVSPQGNYHNYAKTNLYDVIGMHDASADGTKTSFQSARSMARFGLMMLADGSWNGVDVIADKSYLAQMITGSQSFNESYGWLTWLNGKNSYMAPKDATVYPGPLFPDAPADMYAALGRHDKKIYVVPSMDVVVVRHGPEAPDGGGLAGNSFDNTLWQKLCLAMNCGGSGASTLLAEDFESGNLGGWTTAGNAIVSPYADNAGVYGARIKATASIERQVSTAGYSSVSVEYARRTIRLDAGEYLKVEWSADGVSWNLVEQTQDTLWDFPAVTLPPAAGNQSGFRIRFSINASSDWEWGDLDDILIAGSN